MRGGQGEREVGDKGREGLGEGREEGKEGEGREKRRRERE